MQGCLGVICIVVGCTAVWWMEGLTQKKTMETMAQFAGVMLEMESEIRTQGTTLPRICKGLSLRCTGDTQWFFQTVAQSLQQEHSLFESWAMAVEHCFHGGDLPEILLQLGRSLSGDEQQICKVLSLVNGQLEKNLSQMKVQWPNQRRSAGALCFSGGAMLLILLI